MWEPSVLSDYGWETFESLSTYVFHTYRFLLLACLPALITIIIALLQTAGAHLFPCAMKSLPGSLRLFAFASSTFLNLLTLGMFEYLLSIRNVSLLFHSGLISWRLFFGRDILVTHSLPDDSVHFEIRWWGVCISAMKVDNSRPTTQVRRSMVVWIKKCWSHKTMNSELWSSLSCIYCYRNTSFFASPYLSSVSWKNRMAWISPENLCHFKEIPL